MSKHQICIRLQKNRAVDATRYSKRASTPAGRKKQRERRRLARCAVRRFNKGDSIRQAASACKRKQVSRKRRRRS